MFLNSLITLFKVFIVVSRTARVLLSLLTHVAMLPAKPRSAMTPAAISQLMTVSEYYAVNGKNLSGGVSAVIVNVESVFVKREGGIALIVSDVKPDRRK